MESYEVTAPRLLEWWDKTRAARPMPTRAELDPSELKAILPHLLLVDVIEAPGEAGGGGARSYRYRLSGTEVDSRFGLKLTGLTLEELPIGPEARDAIRQQYETAIAERRPIFCRHNMAVNDERYVEYDRVVMPLADATGENMVSLVAAVDFHCAFLFEGGRPLTCTRQPHCDRIDLCLQKPHV